MTNPIQTAQERFAKGFNCAQAVFSAYASEFGLDDEYALKLASPFGGGIARHGQVCGAVTGALMALGLKSGTATLETKDEAYKTAEVFIQRFEELHGTIVCRELLGYDLSKLDELQTAREQGVFTSACPVFVNNAAELVAEILGE